MEECLLICMFDFVSDVRETDFTQDFHEPVKALLPMPRHRGRGLFGSSLGSWAPHRLPRAEGIGPSPPSVVGAEEAAPSLQSPGPAEEGLRGLFLETVQELSLGMATALRPRQGSGSWVGWGPLRGASESPRSQGRSQSRPTGGA